MSMPEGNRKSNIDRFSGFGNVYDRYRPETPQLATGILAQYLGGRPAVVLDLGCGTGLSSFVWIGKADRIIGVEPNDDMRRVAQDKLNRLSGESSLSFVAGYSNRLDVGSGTVDLITCSQSFHWMEPESTLKEVSRALKPNGIFAAYDCDWPPVLDWRIEQLYGRLLERADEVLDELTKDEEKVMKWSKDEHLSRMARSGAFRYTREIVFHNRESCDAERYVGLALSQGGLRGVLRLGSKALDEDIAEFRSETEAHFQGRTLDVLFGYRMRLGVK